VFVSEGYLSRKKCSVFHKNTNLRNKRTPSQIFLLHIQLFLMTSTACWYICCRQKYIQ